MSASAQLTVSKLTKEIFVCYIHIYNIHMKMLIVILSLLCLGFSEEGQWDAELLCSNTRGEWS